MFAEMRRQEFERRRKDVEESPLKKAKPIQRRKKKSKDGEILKDGTVIPGKKRQRKTSQQSLTSPTTGL